LDEAEFTVDIAVEDVFQKVSLVSGFHVWWLDNWLG
jgi:hypothetical protein